MSVRLSLASWYLVLLVGCSAATPTNGSLQQDETPPAVGQTSSPLIEGSDKPPPTVSRSRSASAKSLRVATWNLRRLGYGKKRLDRLAKIISQFDMVAVQEVMTTEAIDSLLAELPGWRAAVSERSVGRGTYKELYAVLYRSERVALERDFLAKDPDDQFTREPYVACFRAQSFDFCVVDIHVIFGRRVGERDAEIAALAKLVTRWREASEEKDWLVMGDFNRSAKTPGWEDLQNAGWKSVAAEELRTSLGDTDYTNAYDHIAVDRRFTSELDGVAQRIDIVAQVCDGDFERCSLEVSDHAPVQARFRLTGPDDD